jgi:hypothetical protein
MVGVAAPVGIVFVSAYLIRSGLPAIRDYFRLPTDRKVTDLNHPEDTQHQYDGM